MYSYEHKVFIKKNKNYKLLVNFCQFTLIIFFIYLWQFLADKNYINVFILSSPKRIIDTLIKLHISNNLYHHILITIYETMISFILGTVIGFFIASLLWWNKFLFKVLDPYLTVLNSLPKIALGPIIIIWGGAGIKSIIIMALLISTIITIINVTEYFNNIDQNKLKLLKSFNANKKQIYFKLVFPSAISGIINTLKINISMSLIGVTMGEFLVSKEGIGYLIVYGSQTFNLNLVITGVIVLSIISALMYYIVFYIEKKLKH